MKTIEVKGPSNNQRIVIVIDKIESLHQSLTDSNLTHVQMSSQTILVQLSLDEVLSLIKE